MKKAAFLLLFTFCIGLLFCSCGPAAPAGANYNAGGYNLDPGAQNPGGAGGNAGANPGANVGGEPGGVMGGTGGGNVAGQSFSKTGGLASKAKITLEEAKAAAVEHAGLALEGVRFVKLGMEDEDGRLVYEVAFVKDDQAYRYTIDAFNGEVREFSQRLLPQRREQRAKNEI